MGQEILDHVRILTALVTMALNQLLNEKRAYENALREAQKLIKEDVNSILEKPDLQNFRVKEFPAQLAPIAQYVIKNTDTIFASARRTDNGGLMVICNKEQEEKLVEVEKRVYSIVKSFNLAKDDLKNLSTEADQVVTTSPADQPGSLTPEQLLYLSYAITDAGVSYSIDYSSGTLSYLQSQKDKIEEAIRKCAADLSSDDFLLPNNEAKTTAAIYQEIEMRMSLLEGSDAIYVYSGQRTSDNSANYLKITKNAISEVYVSKRRDGTISEVELGQENYTPDDHGAVYAKLLAFPQPMIPMDNKGPTEPDRINAFIKENIDNIYPKTTNKTTTIITDILRKYGNEADLKNEDPAKQLNNYINEKDDPTLIALWNEVKAEWSTNQINNRINAYTQMTDHLTEQVLNAEQDAPSKDQVL